MKTGLRIAMSLLVIVAFVAIGALVGFVISLPSDLIGAIAGGGHGGAHGRGSSYEHTVIIATSAAGLAGAVAVVWGMWRNRVLVRWFAAISVSSCALLLAVLLGIWQYPVAPVLVALVVPVIAMVYLYTESKGIRRGSQDAGA